MRVGWRQFACVLSLLMVGCRREATPSAQRQSEGALDAGTPGRTSDLTPATPDSGIGTPVSAATWRSAAGFAREFYDWYAKIGERDGEATRDRPTLFSPALRAAVRAQLAAPALTLEESLDGLMFIGGSQERCSPYQVQRVTRRGDTILVALKGSCVEFTAELGRARGRWVLLDVLDDDSMSLLSELARLRRVRDSVRLARPG